MQIPWNELKNKPVKITINGVYIAADAASTILSEEDLEQEFIWKLEALSTAELLLERRLKKSNVLLRPGCLNTAALLTLL